MELISAPAPNTPSKKIPAMLIFILIVSLAANAVQAYQNQLLKTQVRQMIEARRPEPLISPSPSSTLNPEASESGGLFHTFVDRAKKFSLQYPNDWSLTENQLNQTETVSLKKLGWEIKVEATQEFVKDQCGGSGPVSGAAKNLYQDLTVLGRSAGRTTLEKGNYWAVAGQTEPFPQPILFRRLPDELTIDWPTPDTDQAYVYKFCYENMNKTISLKITYLSDQFTLEKIQTMAVDKIMLGEMDKIITSLKLE